MYEHMTFEAILERALSKVESDVDKRQGSIIWDALAPACAELAQMYIELDNILRLTYAETSFGTWLDKRCAEMGVHRKAATKAVRLGVMYGRNKAIMDIPIGSCFSIETVNYTVLEKIETGKYKLVCQQEGIIGNHLYGKLIPVESISGLAAAELLDVLIPGENEEKDGRLYERYVEKVNSTPYGGNIDDYKQKVKAVEGVGDCEVFPVWNGGGTVKVTIVNSEFDVPSATLVEAVQELLDPVPYAQQGMGLAPIGHLVTVAGAEGVKVSLSTKLIIKLGMIAEQVRPDVEEAFKEYLAELCRGWAAEDGLIIRTSQIEAKILDIPGIIDISETTLNDVAGNLILGREQIPIPGGTTLG